MQRKKKFDENIKNHAWVHVLLHKETVINYHHVYFEPPSKAELMIFIYKLSTYIYLIQSICITIIQF